MTIQRKDSDDLILLQSILLLLSAISKIILYIMALVKIVLKKLFSQSADWQGNDTN